MDKGKGRKGKNKQKLEMVSNQKRKFVERGGAERGKVKQQKRGYTIFGKTVFRNVLYYSV